MSSLRYWLLDYRVLAALGVIALAALAYFGAEPLFAIGGGVLAAIVLGLLAWLAVALVRRAQARGAGQRLEAMVQQQADRPAMNAPAAARADAEVLRARMAEAVKAIKTSRLGQLKGRAALYELPWYVTIGNPAAGKSTAILNSGLRFPFADNRGSVIHGLGGTRNCDWYFTTEGIVLDTAGRYTVSAEDRLEWLTFLDLLKQHRPRAPINGIVIAASVAELSASKPEFAIELAKNLRQRVQELTERLEVHAPVYVVFTKADLISGFAEFFQGLDPAERENAWGATLPYAIAGHGDPRADALAAFDGHFDLLCDGLNEMSLAQMALRRGRAVPPGLLSLPMEFAAIKPALRTFIATLFEPNPYQFKPVFRGFYFTSALQEGAAARPGSERIARRFELGTRAATEPPTEPAPPSEHSHFLLGLFRKVIFADRELVRQYASPARTRLRYAAFLGAVALLALALAGWTWSYTGNRQLVADAGADLAKAAALQRGRLDLQSRVEALLLLQDRLEQLARYRERRPFGLGLGLYQGAAIEAKLRAEYFHGMRQLMLAPVATKLEDYLGAVIARRDALRPAAAAEARARDDLGGAAPDASRPAEIRLYEDASPTDPDDAYAALKAYLMLGDRARVEPGHLNDQLTRFWRGWLEANRGAMPREAMARAADRLMTFHVDQARQPGWPQLELKYSLVDDSRQALRQVMKGTPARDRVYAQIKARAATRFAPVTTARLLGAAHASGGITGSHQISGAFTRAAWDEYVEDAIRLAASSELSSTDWVLEAAVQNDLTLAGSPQHVAKELTALYKAEYAREWRRFLQGVSIAPFGDFDHAVARMNRLGDPSNSPLRRLLEAVEHETGWDHPTVTRAADAPAGVAAWFHRVVLRRAPDARVAAADAAAGPSRAGPIGREFAGLARLRVGRDGAAPLLDRYFDALGKIRARFNAIKTEGDPGPGARQLMQQTLDGNGSELAEALRLVDERMLNGLDERQRAALRPLLLRPLIQGFAALVRPAEGEINRSWTAQVYEPFRDGIGQKYPYAPTATVEAAPTDIDRIFGPAGAIAQFSQDALGSLVIRRGNALAPRQWAGIGIRLRPELIANYAGWIGAGAAADRTRMVFQLLPLPAPGNEYSVTIDGQQLRYRNTPAQWHTFSLPGPGVPGVRISTLTTDGRTVEVFSAVGADATAQMFAAAQREDLGPQHYRLGWTRGGATVALELRIISVVQPNATADDVRGLQLPAQVAGAAPAPTATASAGPTMGVD